MFNIRNLALLVGALIVALLVAWQLRGTPQPHASQSSGHAESGQDDGHGHAPKESGHAAGEDDHDDDEQDDGHGHGKGGHAGEDDGHGHAEGGHDEKEGQLHLSEAQIQAAGIGTEKAAARQMASAITYAGEIRFNEDRTAHIVPRVEGIVESVAADLGQSVRKGQVLAVIASIPVAQLRSDYQAAQRRLALSQQTYERERQLWQERISAEQDYLQARQALQESEIAVASLRDSLQALGVGASGGNRYELRAPFDGQIIEKHLTLGERVDQASNAFTLSDLSKVWATFGVPARELARVQVGREVSVSAPDLQARVQGRIHYVGSLLGEQTRTASVRVELDNPEGAWRPGLAVEVALASDQRAVAVSIPHSAVHEVEGQSVVFVRTAEGFEVQPVVLGLQQQGYVAVEQGLAVGVEVATRGSFFLKSELGKGSAEHSH